MSEPNWTPEPWVADEECPSGQDILLWDAERNNTICDFCTDEKFGNAPPFAEAIANRDRVKACVDACAGFDPVAMRDLAKLVTGRADSVDIGTWWAKFDNVVERLRLDRGTKPETKEC